MKGKLTRCALYIRVSSDEQAKYGDSMRDQKERGLEYIDGHKDMILQDVYIDDGISGQKIDRGDFKRLIDSVKNHEVDLIIFTKLDRWFRNLRHYLNIQAILEENEVAWIAIDQPYFDTSTPHGRAFVAQSMMWAELEAQNDGVRIHDVFVNKIKYGEVVTGKVPRGYKIEDKHLVFSEEAPVIYDCIQHYLKSQSLGATLKYMREQYGIVMTIQNFRQSILLNEKYTGRYRGNENYCPRLISDEDFEKISLILKKNIKPTQKYDYIFSGILICDECNHKLSACHINVKTIKNNGTVYRYRYPAYECKQNRSYHNCKNGGEIRESKIEEYLLTHIRAVLEEYVVKYDNQDKKIFASASPENRAAKIMRKIDRLKDLYLNEIISLNEYKADRLKLESDLQQISTPIKPPKDLSHIQRFLDTDFESIYDSLNNVERRQFWREIISEVRVSKSFNRVRRYTIIPL